LIYFRDVSLAFLDKKLFDHVNWTIHPKSRIGLVGENGTGKTTLFRMIMGDVHPDSGIVEISGRRQKIFAYLPQEVVAIDSVPLMDFLKQKSGIAAIEESVQKLEQQLSRIKHNSPEYTELSHRYADALERFNVLDGYAFEATAKQILKGLGFREADFARNCSFFSGGWKMRILQASLLLTHPDVMLLDEPTNHLDTESMEWLESYLKDYRGTLMVISHDHFFLDKVVQQIADLSSCKVHIYKGNYSSYLAEKEKRREALKKEMELQKAQIKKIGEFVERFRYKATKAAQVQSRIRMLERFSEITLEKKTKNVVMKFPEGKKSTREVVQIENLGHSYRNLRVFGNLNFSLFRGDKVAFVGVNGSGKSTLSRLLSLMEKPSQGTVKYGEGVRMAFFSQESSENLNYAHTIWEEIHSVATKASDPEKRNLLGAFLFSGDDIFKPVSVLSGGEKSKLALLKVMLTDTNFLILDEPTNHLDIKTKDIFQDALIHYHGTIAIVSHDRYFLDRLVNKVFELKDGAIREYHGNYSYFIEKRSLSSSACLPDTVKKDGQMLKKENWRTREQKRADAEERNRISKLRAACKKDLTAIEQKINTLEADKSRLETDLCSPQVFKDALKIKETNLKLKEINEELEKSYNLWAEVHTKWEEVVVE